ARERGTRQREQPGVLEAVLGDAARKLGHRRGADSALQVAAQTLVALDEARLLDDVEAAPASEKRVGHRVQLEARGERARRLARPLRDGAQLGAVLGEQRHDKVALPELRLAQN